MMTYCSSSLSDDDGWTVVVTSCDDDAGTQGADADLVPIPQPDSSCLPHTRAYPTRLWVKS
jgi:hypothetical protein